MVSKKSAVLILLATFLLAFGLTLSEGRKFPDSVRLVYKPEAGTSTTYKMEVRASAKLINMEEENYPGVPQESTTFGKFIFSDKILDVTPEGKILEELTYGDVELEMEVNGRRQNLPFANRLEGKSILMEIDKDGRVISTKGLDQFSEELKDLRIQDMYIQFRPIFPDRELKVGDSWDNRTESAIPIESMLNRTKIEEKYTLSGFKERGNSLCAVIRVKLEIYTIGKTVKKEEGVDIDVDMEGKGEGEILYAFKDSRLLSSQIDLDLTSRIRSSAYREVQEIEMKHRVEMVLEEWVIEE
ncbi:DUF6263 family protein [bacterium]|nr:DUF6263 family protein [bacterium]